jgi:hypothetical protein
LYVVPSERSTKLPPRGGFGELTPEQIYAIVATPRSLSMTRLTDAQKRRMSEFMGGYRQIGSAEAGNRKISPTRARRILR